MVSTKRRAGVLDQKRPGRGRKVGDLSEHPDEIPIIDARNVAQALASVLAHLKDMVIVSLDEPSAKVSAHRVSLVVVGGSVYHQSPDR